MSVLLQCALLLGVAALLGCNEPADVRQAREDMGLVDAGGMAQVDSAQAPSDVSEVDGNPCPAHIVDPDECEAHEGCRVDQGAPLEVSNGMCTEVEGAKPITLCSRNDVSFVGVHPPPQWVYWRDVSGSIEYIRVLKGGDFNGWTSCGAQSTDPLVVIDPPPMHDGVVLDGCNPEICFMGPLPF